MVFWWAHWKCNLTCYLTGKFVILNVYLLCLFLFVLSPGRSKLWAQNAYRVCCACAPGGLAPLACARPRLIPSPLARAQKLDSTLMPRWCAHTNLVCPSEARLGALQLVPRPLSIGEELGGCPSEFHPKCWLDMTDCICFVRDRNLWTNMT